MRPLPGTSHVTARQPDDHDESSLVSSDSTVRSTSSETSRDTHAVRTGPPGSAASVKLLSSSAVAGTKLQPMPLDAPDTTGPRAAPLKSGLPFDSVPARAAKIFTIAADVDYNITVSHQQMRDAIARKPENKSAHALLKGQSGADAKQRDETAIDSAYQRMKLGRKDFSPLEIYLEKIPDFRHLLFAPTGGVRDTSTGLYAELRRMPGSSTPPDYVLCFPGTGCAGGSDAQWKANVAQLTGIGGVAKLYMQALGLAGEIKKVLVESGATLSVAGHSLGGGIANFVGLALDLDSCCFNAASLGPASLDYLDIHGCLTTERIDRQVHVGFGDDWVTHPTLMKGARAMAKLAAGASGRLKASLVGRVYHLPPGDPLYPADKDVFERHQLASLGSPLHQSTRNARTAVSSSSSTPLAHPPPAFGTTDPPVHETSSAGSESGSTSHSTGDQQ